ncbi:glutathione-regulated potassium-efflux system K+/H+ antiporter [Nitzschia inconspicua]|uniref:Glutathione-regulated potassium-efflux system K+/H+ antiporter n=1 Tax=Nitzschia inconspicua TaxID=303405 RepID=A0A9K3PLX2_9STRA|nr:glutathione-regulated potassium-efflux system K+/H+ antiporter [Nitzschia inconspicua]
MDADKSSHRGISSASWRSCLILLLAAVLHHDASAFNSHRLGSQIGRTRQIQLEQPLRYSSVKSFRSVPLVFHTHKNSVQLEDNDDELQRGWSHRRVEAFKRFAARARIWMSRAVVWKSKKGKSFLAAMALFCAVYFGSGVHNSIEQYTPHISQSTEVHIMTPRGGGGDKAAAAKPAKSSAPRWVQKEKKVVKEVVVTAADKTSRTLQDAMMDLKAYMAGPKSDTLLLLLATALITPICKRIGMSPILGFLASGMLLGPNGCGLISGIHTTETLAELGIVFFLFEMGIELSVERLLSMKRDVFGLGLSQFLGTALAVAGVGKLLGLPANALVVLGGGLALSSSAFVLQLLKDKKQLATRFGKASFGVLLFQDLAVVPLLVVTPILAGGGSGLAQALGSAVLKAAIALGAIAAAGRYLLNPLFKIVASSRSQEAFLGVILLTVLSMSFMTEGLGLSNTLGAFLAGVLLSETKYRYQVEADIAPFRGVLLGLFFVTVGFEIDVFLIASNLPQVAAIVMGILAVKTVVLTLLSLAFGLSFSTSQQTGLILSQGGEFAFVAFGLARSFGILDKPTTKLLLTCVSLTMALTPAMASLGGRISKTLEERSDFTHYLGQDRDANEIKESDDFAVVIGYGAVGKVVCDLLDRKLIKYVGIDIDPNKAIQARNAGLPVFYGDIGRQEVADAFNVGKAKAVIVCISDRDQANRAVIALRRWFPDLKIFCRARDKDHAFRLQSTLDVAAMVPILPEDNLLLTLPFGGAVLRALGGSPEEVNAILEAKRKEVMSGKLGEENEEDMALVQLGIDVEDVKKKPVNGTRADDDEDKYTAAAIERIGATKAKSPFVAEVIGDVCPEAEEDEKNKAKLPTVESSAPKGALDAEVVMDFSEEERQSDEEERQKRRAEQLVEAAASLSAASEKASDDDKPNAASP